MTNYNNIIEKTNNYYSFVSKKLNTKKNEKIKNLNLKNKSNTSIKIINQNNSNSKKDYKNNLLKLSNKNKISIFLKGLNLIQNNIKKIITKK
jgi:hypothetical protein